MAYIIQNGKRINYTLSDKDVTFSDGKVATPSVSNMDIKLAYQTAKVPSAPVIIPPVGAVREMTLRELEAATDVTGNIKIKPWTGSDQFQISNLNNAVIDLSQVLVQNSNIPFFEMKGHWNNVTIKGGQAKNLNAKVFSYRFDKYFDGTDATLAKNIIIDGFSADNTGPLFANDSRIEGGKIYGGMAGIGILNTIVKNSPNIGSVVYLAGVRNALLQGNIIDLINANNKDHNGVYMITGNAIVRGNKITRHEGTGVRLIPTKIGNASGQDALFENNLIEDSIRYGGFEAQAYPILNSGIFNPIDIVIQRNSFYNLNSDRHWSGQGLDVYDTYGLITFKDNLGGNLFSNDKITDMIHYENVSAVTKVNSSGNKYFATKSEALAYQKINPSVGADLK